MKHFGFKAIDSFTYDECISAISQACDNGIEPDEDIVSRRDRLLLYLKKKDDNAYKKAQGNMVALKQYVDIGLKEEGASSYRPRHIRQAQKQIAILVEIKRKKDRKDKISWWIYVFISSLIAISFLLLVALVATDAI